MSLKRFVDKLVIDLTSMQYDGMIETVYCLPVGVVNNPSQIQYGTDEVLVKLKFIAERSYSLVDRRECNDELILRFYVVLFCLITVICCNI